MYNIKEKIFLEQKNNKIKNKIERKNKKIRRNNLFLNIASMN